MPDLSQFAQSPTIAAIDQAWERREAQNERRGYIGASSLGKPCERALWYEFRWATPHGEVFPGRMLRLFNTGHVEEDRMIEWLRMAGIEVVSHIDGEQISFEDLEGHFRGHMDGEALGVIEAPKTWHVVEFKTHNLKSFAQLLKTGVAVAKPEHVAQMQIYMHFRGRTRALYMAKCKDDDRLYIERIEYDAAHAMELIAKAERIKSADRSAPPRISDNPDYYLCKAFKCPAYGMCHGGEFAERNCRTCIHVTPVEGGNWHCARHDKILSRDDQQAGCAHHLYLPSLVPGDQIDSNPENETITYQMPDGASWTDGIGANQ